MRLLYLYTELGPYNFPVLRVLTNRYRADVQVISWDDEEQKPYAPPAIPGVTYQRRSTLSAAQIREFALRFDPNVTYVSGWTDRGYLPAARALRRRGAPVVCGLDSLWAGGLRQRVGSAVFRRYLSRLFSHAWVAGPRQYEFARRLGFRDDRIIFDLLSCDYALFARQRAAVRPGAFLYVGNFRAVKGTDILAAAFAEYRDRLGGDWTLICAGCGELGHLLENQAGVTVHPFLPQRELLELCTDVGCFVLPSRHDQWGVVVHEFAALGLPLIVSRTVGAKAVFFIEGYNGISYTENTPQALAHALAAMAKMPQAELQSMGENSIALAGRITPETSAANLISVAR